MYLGNPSSVERYFADPMLANSQGHELLADILISYFQSQTCAAWATAVGTAPELIPGPGPAVHQEKAKTPTDARGLFGGGTKLHISFHDPTGSISEGRKKEATKALKKAVSKADQKKYPYCDVT